VSGVTLLSPTPAAAFHYAYCRFAAYPDSCLPITAFFFAALPLRHFFSVLIVYAATICRCRRYDVCRRFRIDAACRCFSDD